MHPPKDIVALRLVHRLKVTVAHRPVHRLKVTIVPHLARPVIHATRASMTSTVVLKLPVVTIAPLLARPMFHTTRAFKTTTAGPRILLPTPIPTRAIKASTAALILPLLILNNTLQPVLTIVLAIPQEGTVPTTLTQ